ncbi:MAG: hypothetical protein MR842_02480 [Clostridiales bacterium]|nr:hypothetical protein [Clostridiales bacterium]MDO4350487.1 hypothetical protein [Eubacteriales bacterium]MDY4009301.1 hypothetical protein [Candidatus Limiplasma sp.]
MRGLKIAAIASVSLLLVMALLVGYLFLTAEVQAAAISAQGISAGNDPDAFEQLKNAVTEGTFQGTLYQKPLEWKDASEYVYLTYTLRIRNNCLVPIDMIEVQVVPQSTDILQMGDFAVHSLQAKTEGDITVRVLAPKDTHPVREIIVTYYVWGVSFNLKTTYGG